jgi:hypothetical protein
MSQLREWSMGSSVTGGLGLRRGATDEEAADKRNFAYSVIMGKARHRVCRSGGVHQDQQW